MPCELCGADEPLVVVPDIYDRVAFRICKRCRTLHARVRPSSSSPRSDKPRSVGGSETRRPRLPPEIDCPICGGTGGDVCSACAGTGGDIEQRPCSLCEGDGTYECYRCGGSGRRLLGACSTCSGSGKVSCEKCGGDGVETVKHSCAHCEGSGHLCHRCSGRKVIRLYN
jgi:hypothetical protein